MSVEIKLLNRLKAEQLAFAVNALTRTQQRDAYEYGYRVGIFAGYEAAINVLLKLLEEEKTGVNDL